MPNQSLRAGIVARPCSCQSCQGARQIGGLFCLYHHQMAQGGDDFEKGEAGGALAKLL